ncbi:MAG: cisplatin damage response ATP-dependent DNA ligase [Beijerinckiaceae bacterium]|nr:cisplatin damage response ATP-dependent DNA ligase [Beijerinckiaceae bacterium]
MNGFAALIDRLAYEPRRNGKLALMEAYFRDTPDPERGFALAAMTGSLKFANAKSGLIRALMAERIDPVLFDISYDYVGDLSETVALLWKPRGEAAERIDTPLADIVEALTNMRKLDLPGHLARWLDALDETGRWALLKLITGGLRIGVSARLAKTAVANLGGLEANAVEQVWHGLKPPYLDLFAWVEGRGPMPEANDPAPFRPVMLAHPLEDSEIARLDPSEFVAEWKWDGIRVQAVSGRATNGERVTRLYSRTGEDISTAFPDLVDTIDFDCAIDGELLVMREGRVESFNILQQRLNRKSVSPKLLLEYPAHIRAYDIIADGGEADVRTLPFEERRQRLGALLETHPRARIDLSPLVPFESFEDLQALRASPSGEDSEAIEGCMLKRRDSPYVPGRPKGFWFKWKRDPLIVDCVLMYGQRGHGKRSSFYSDFTFGVWRAKAGSNEEELVPVGKAYFGFTDEELIELDRYVRKAAGQRFGPVKEVALGRTADGRPVGLVLEIAFEGLQRSTRHKSGVAMRFPRISRIRWDKPADEADRIDALERLLSPTLLEPAEADP